MSTFTCQADQTIKKLEQVVKTMLCCLSFLAPQTRTQTKCGYALIKFQRGILLSKKVKMCSFDLIIINTSS